MEGTIAGVPVVDTNRRCRETNFSEIGLPEISSQGMRKFCLHSMGGMAAQHPMNASMMS